MQIKREREKTKMLIEECDTTQECVHRYMHTYTQLHIYIYIFVNMFGCLYVFVYVCMHKFVL